MLHTICDEVEKRSDALTHLALAWQRARASSLRDIMKVLVPATLISFVLYVCLRSALFLGSFASSLLAIVAIWAKVMIPLFRVFPLDPSKLLGASTHKRIEFVREFSTELTEVMQKMPRGTRLIVFVDDLDRCPPDRIVDVLETMNMLSDASAGYFVLAVDQVIIRRAIEYSYRDMLAYMREQNSSEADAFGTRYLEKMITLGIKVPELRAEEVDPEQTASDAGAIRPWKQFLENLRPPNAWVWAFGLVTITAMMFQLVTKPYGGVQGVAEGVGKILVASVAQPAAPETSTSSAKTTPPPDAPATRTEAPPAATETSPALGSVADGPIRVRVRAREPAALATPAIASEGVPSPTPAEELNWSRMLALMVSCASGAVAFILLGLAIDQWRKRRQVEAQQAAGSDSDVFKQALKDAKKQLVANPRNVVRFTNSARFLFHVMSESREGKVGDWHHEFFPRLIAHWQAVRGAGGDHWVQREITGWLPDVSSGLARSTVRRNEPPPA